MNDDLDNLVVGVRTDTAAFARDVAAMRSELEGPLVISARRAGSAIESALLGAIRRGKFGFEDLSRIAVSIIDDIARAALRSGLESLGVEGGPGGGSGGGFAALLGGLLGLPGRATGGPVSGGRAFLVGERGPEVFVPTSAGRIEPIAAAGPREVRIGITINAPAGQDAPRALQRSSRQVAAAVRRALAER